MKLRVDLLKDTERRYQGPVSMRFMIRAGGVTLALVLFVFGGLAIQRQVMLRYRLKSATEEWARLGPRYEEITKRQAVVSSYKGLLDELNGWGMTNSHWYDMLLELQKTVPPNVQLSKLNVDGGWEFIKPEKKKEPPKKEGAKLEEKPAAKEVIVQVTPARSIRLSIGGRVQGELADEIVVQFTKSLEKSKGFDTYFDTMELEKLFRVEEGGRESSGIAWRQFEIQGLSKARPIP
jgi:hypothetical protein